MVSTSPARDGRTVADDGAELAPLPEGVQVRDAVLHTDDRGSLCEIYDPRWGFSEEPVVYVYFATVRPGIVKGWAMHKAHDDRYFLIGGEVEVVLYDAREDSPTCGLLAKVYLTEQRRQLLSIPAGVWHADHNIGTKDAVLVNMPTVAFDKANPDKYRLPLDTDQIPHSFGGARGY